MIDPASEDQEQELPFVFLEGTIGIEEFFWNVVINARLPVVDKE